MSRKPSEPPAWSSGDRHLGQDPAPCRSLDGSNQTSRSSCVNQLPDEVDVLRKATGKDLTQWSIQKRRGEHNRKDCHLTLRSNDVLPPNPIAVESIQARQVNFQRSDQLLQTPPAQHRRDLEASYEHIRQLRSNWEKPVQGSLTAIDSPSLSTTTYAEPSSADLAHRAFLTQVAIELDPNNYPPYRALQRRIDAERNWRQIKAQPLPSTSDAATVVAMAAVKKYEGLPDLDLGTEIYEVGRGVPELTEGSTLRSESDAEEAATESKDVDRRVLDREAARRRFEPAMVDARTANFGDTVVSADRRDYKTGHRRRRRRRIVEAGDDDQEEYRNFSDEDETLHEKIARLKREAEEVNAEIARMESGADDNETEFKDSVEQQSQEAKEQAELQGGAQQLSDTLNALSSRARRKHETLEDEFTRHLNAPPASSSTTTQQRPVSEDHSAPPLQAITSFSDRLTALESLLGISPLHPTTTSQSILPTLTTLNAQIQTLHATLAPHPNLHAPSTTAPSTVHLDALSTRLQTLISESHRLESSRRTAQKAFEELLEARDRHAHLFQHSSLSRSPTSPQQNLPKAVQASAEKTDSASTQQQISNLFLDTQSARIQSLHALLPQIQSMQPLLPTVLERLRALSIVHEGAADARAEIDEVESRLGVLEAEQKKWRDSVEGLEREVAESRGILGDNVKTLTNMVGDLEQRVQTLKASQ